MDGPVPCLNKENEFWEIGRNFQAVIVSRWNARIPSAD